MADKVFQDIFKLEIEKMIKESEYIDPLAHNGVKGTIRELGLGKLLSRFLPNYLKVGSGQVHNRKGLQSHETDLIIYDKNKLPPILFNDILGVFPIESVVYAMEIKSTSTREEMKTSVVKFKDLSRLIQSNQQIGIRSVYFAYKSNLTGKTELERYFELDNKTNPFVTIICVVGDGYYYCSKSYVKVENCNIEGVINNSNYILLEWVGMREESHYEVLCFMAGILNTLREYHIGHYILNEGCFDTFYQALLDGQGNIVYETQNFSGISSDELLQNKCTFRKLT